MKQQTKTQLILSIMNVIFWITFIGLCIKAGAFTFSFIVSLFVNVAASKDLYLGLDLSSLSVLGSFHYITIALAIIVTSVLKAYIAYLAVKISMKLRLAQPFHFKISALIAKISYAALAAAVFQISAQAYYNALLETGAQLPPIQLQIGEGGGFLFLAGIIFIISQIFKRGLEIQSENDLTI